MMRSRTLGRKGSPPRGELARKPKAAALRSIQLVNFKPDASGDNGQQRRS